MAEKYNSAGMKVEMTYFSFKGNILITHNIVKQLK